MMEYTLKEYLTEVKEIEKIFNVKCYVFGKGVRRFFKTGKICSVDYETLIDSDEVNDDILLLFSNLKITFMPLKSFLNSRMIEAEKIVIGTDGMPIAKGKSLKSLRENTIYFNTVPTGENSTAIVSSLLSYINEGFNISDKSMLMLKGKIDIDIDTLCNLLEMSLDRNDDFIGRNIMRLFCYADGVGKMLNNKGSLSLTNFNDLCWLSYVITSTINQISYIPITDDFCKLKVVCYHIALGVYKKKFLYPHLINEVEARECVEYLFSNVLKLDDISLNNHINEMEYIIETHLKTKTRFSIVNYYKDFNNIDKVKRGEIDVNFYYATLFM